MKTIAQRALRNEISDVLRRAEAGERFVITVNGRSVAQLGPCEPRYWVAADTVRALLTTPTDPGLLDDLRAAHPEGTRDPWL